MNHLRKCYTCKNWAVKPEIQIKYRITNALFHYYSHCRSINGPLGACLKPDIEIRRCSAYEVYDG